MKETVFASWDLCGKYFWPLRRQGTKFFFGTLFLLLSICTFAQKEVPELWGHRVHDDANVLKHETVDQLERMLEVHEDSTSNQIAVLIINSVDGEVLEDYSMRVVEKWKLGTKEKDNGVLLLIAVDDHKMRIEVGYGLEGVLTDALCNRIIRNELAPNFRRNDYDAGVLAGVTAIIQGIGGEYTSDDFVSEDTDFSSMMPWAARIGIGAFIFFILGMFTFVSLTIKGGGAWGMYAFLIPFYATFPFVVLGKTGGLILLGFYIIGFPILKIILNNNRSWQAKMNRWQTSSRSSGGSSGSSWSSSGSSRSSSFSGGGGSFGGGGSSGGW